MLGGLNFGLVWYFLGNHLMRIIIMKEQCFLVGELVALLVARRTNSQPTTGRLRVRGLLK